MVSYNDIASGWDNGIMQTLYSDYITKIVLQNAEEAKQNGSITNVLGQGWTWKTRTGNKTIEIKTKYGSVRVVSVQARALDGKTHNLTRWLLGIDPYIRIPPQTQNMLSDFLAHGRYRSVQLLVLLYFGLRVSLYSLRRSAIESARRNNAIVRPNENEQQIYYIDGTGAPIVRGRTTHEIQVIMQEYYDGSIHPAYINITKKFSGWAGIFRTISDINKRANTRAILVHDGDPGVRKILDSRECKELAIDEQTCLWHIAHSIENAIIYFDFNKSLKGIKTKDKFIYKDYISKNLRNIFWLKELPPEEAEYRLHCLAEDCAALGLNTVSTFLRHRIYQTQTTKRLQIKKVETTSKCERVFRTVNDRVKRGNWWKKEGLEAVTLSRILWYYNRFVYLRKPQKTRQTLIPVLQ